jgi:hypothetical protein
VLAGGSAAFLTVFSGGRFYVSAGGIANSFTGSSGGIANVLGTVTSNVTVLSGGIDNISSGGLETGSSGFRSLGYFTSDRRTKRGKAG